MTYIQYARLNREQLARLYELEKKLGGWVLAVEPQAEVAELSEEQLQELRAVEEELDVVLLAYRPLIEKE